MEIIPVSTRNGRRKKREKNRHLFHASRTNPRWEWNVRGLLRIICEFCAGILCHAHSVGLGTRTTHSPESRNANKVPRAALVHYKPRLTIIIWHLTQHEIMQTIMRKERLLYIFVIWNRSCATRARVQSQNQTEFRYWLSIEKLTENIFFLIFDIPYSFEDKNIALN